MYQHIDCKEIGTYNRIMDIMLSNCKYQYKVYVQHEDNANDTYVTLGWKDETKPVEILTDLLFRNDEIWARIYYAETVQVSRNIV